MSGTKLTRRFSLIIAVLLAALWITSCDEGGGDGNGLDCGDPEGCGGGGDDTGAPVDYCEDIEWGGGLEVGNTVANWTQNGYMAEDGEYPVVQEEVQFTLEDINCAGHNALVVLLGSTS